VAARNNLATLDERTLVITRVFDAPVSLVWQAWTQGEHIAKWSAPRGFTIPHSEGDLRPGGKWRCCMRGPDGKELWLGGVYREIVPNKLIVMTHAWDDESGRPGPETIVTIRFEELGKDFGKELGAKTKVTLRQTGFDSIQSRDGHAGGWDECLDLLADHLATMRA
jgi:uncharacterized protein YndB with AHSA1/START domain